MIGPAFFNMDSMELVIIVVIALLLFGERLPEVAKSVGKGVMEFRRSLQDLRSQSGIDDAIRKFKDEIQVPDAVRNPTRFLEQQVREVMTEESAPVEAAVPQPTSEESPPTATPPITLEQPETVSRFEAALRDDAKKPDGTSAAS